MVIPSQHGSVENWLRRVSHAGRAQGRNRKSESMSVCEVVSITVSAQWFDCNIHTIVKGF